MKDGSEEVASKNKTKEEELVHQSKEQSAIPADRRHVRLDATTTKPKRVAAAGANSNSSTRPPLIAKSRQKIGKLNVQRDVPVFIAVFTTLLVIAYVSKDVGRPKNDAARKGNMYQKPSSIGQLKETLIHAAKEFKHEQKGRRRKTECNLFFGESTIPSAGLSWYAGRSYRQGEPVLPMGKKLGKYQSNEDIFQNELFLKHHPSIVNIERNSEDQQFMATRNIQAGEELFLSAKEHPQSILGKEHPWFQNIPTFDDYVVAEQILLMEADDKILQQKAPVSNIGRLNVGSNLPFLAKDSALDLVQRITTLFNRRVANLLPNKVKPLLKFFDDDRPFPYYVLQNRTIYWLEVQSKCMDDVILKEDTNHNPTLVTKRSIPSGATILIAPLFVQTSQSDKCVTTDSEETCPSPEQSFCFGHPLSTIQLCPLSWASYLRYTDDSTTSNAVYQFGKWNPRNSQARDMSPDHILRDMVTGMTLDIVATRTIAEGEEVVLSITDGTLTDYGIAMSDYKFPPKWCSRPTSSD